MISNFHHLARGAWRGAWSLLIFATLQSSPGFAADGHYEGLPVEASWNATDRTMTLLKRLDYFDPSGVDWDAPAGWKVDGASIPQFAWSIIGGPFEGKYRDASVLHDVACDRKTRPWEDVHLMFYNAMITSGVEGWRAKIMYAAVFHFGPRWPRDVPVAVSEISSGTLSAAVAAVRRIAPADSGVTVAENTAQPNPQAAPGPNVLVHVVPPQNTLTENDFQSLSKEIEAREGTAAGAMTIEEIQNYKAP